MELLSKSERAQVQPLAELAYVNPFLPERVALERQILGQQYETTRGEAWSFELDEHGQSNIQHIASKLESFAHLMRDRLVAGVRGVDQDYQLYEDLVVHLLYLRMHQIWRTKGNSQVFRVASTWGTFHDEFQSFLSCVDIAFPSREKPEHIFAGIYQIYRAFGNIFQNVIGRSSVMTQLRAAIWQSIFTHDIRRYRRSLYRDMGQIATLIVGPSGTGKELVARAIGRSQYQPFDARKQVFAAEGDQAFYSLHLAALPGTLIESELFGHAKNSFTGASRDRIGWLENAGPHGAVFLDEIGEIDSTVQVKLLRVLQTRQFQRIGEQTSRQFLGKLITATNRDLSQEVDQGTFRRDLYFRLCGDIIKTRTLQEQLSDAPEDLEQSIRFITRQLAPAEVDSVVSEVLYWIACSMPAGYAWPGNFRELEQCVRNILVHNRYEFTACPVAVNGGELSDLAHEIQSLSMTAEQLLSRYCTFAYWKTGNYEQAAELLQLDRRTVRSKIDEAYLAKLKSSD